MNIGKTFTLGGKYRDIVLAAGLFVVFDLGVLILNFYTSFEIAEDATAINLAGRQRMLSQRMTKTLLQTETAATAEDRDRAINELAITAKLFGDTYTAFEQGGQTKNTDGSDYFLNAATDPDAQRIMSEADAIWLPLQSNIRAVTDSPDNASALASALALANRNNLSLLKLMNQLTTRLAELAQKKAERLRMFQTIGITLALINFGLLLFHFIRKLGRSDAAADEARQETEEILNTVNDGFFLVDKDLNLGHQQSAAMSGIFKRDIEPNTPFLGLLQGKVSQNTLDTTREYIELLFTKRIRENLATDLNPLVKLEIDLSPSANYQDIHYLNIAFKRVQSEGKISHLLGTVIDITEQVLLERSLEAAEARSQEEMELLSQILQGNPLSLKEYLEETKQLLLKINHMLEASTKSSDHADILHSSLPAIHKAKGDASALGSTMFTGLTHELETIMKQAQNSPRIGSHELLPVTVHINGMLAKIATVTDIIDKITRLSATMASPARPRDQLWAEDFNTLLNKINQDMGKITALNFRHENLEALRKDDASKLRNVCIQMIRNAIAHGIETPDERKKSGKADIGTVSIELAAKDDKTTLIIRDDGQGLSPSKIRTALLTKGIYTQQQLTEMDDKSVIMSIFNSGLSTADELSEHSGQGVGLSIVKEAIKELGGQLGIASRPGKFTEFRMTFSNVTLDNNAGEMAA